MTTTQDGAVQKAAVLAEALPWIEASTARRWW